MRTRTLYASLAIFPIPSIREFRILRLNSALLCELSPDMSGNFFDRIDRINKIFLYSLYPEFRNSEFILSKKGNFYTIKLHKKGTTIKIFQLQFDNLVKSRIR